MAAAAKNKVGASDNSNSSSSSDDEALKRCQEAVWQTPTDKKKDGDSDVQPSKRIVVAEHKHDGNELQVSQGFQTHVAKKLGHLLDGSFTETEKTFRVEPTKCDGDDDDEGFRLFSSSIPGQKIDDTPAPVRRRPVPSSSDSDSEMDMRLKEAAVSIKDLLPSTLTSPPAEIPCSGSIKEKGEGEESNVVKKKKKKKRKRTQEDSGCAGDPLSPQSNGDHGNSERELTQVKVKRKKKREGHTEDLD